MPVRTTIGRTGFGDECPAPYSWHVVNGQRVCALGYDDQYVAPDSPLFGSGPNPTKKLQDTSTSGSSTDLLKFGSYAIPKSLIYAEPAAVAVGLPGGGGSGPAPAPPVASTVTSSATPWGLIAAGVAGVAVVGIFMMRRKRGR